MSETPARRAHAAIVRIDPTSGARLSIPFQYNPDTLKRSLQPTTVGGQAGGHSEAVRFVGAPAEMFSLTVELEGRDDLPSPALNAAATSVGVFPLLYALEMLLYPPSADIERATRLLASGTMEIAPSLAPPALLVWGPNRVVPVAVQSLEIVERAFDLQLNPLRAVVDVTLRVMSYSDIVSSSAVYEQYMTYQKSKEFLSGLSS